MSKATNIFKIKVEDEDEENEIVAKNTHVINEKPLMRKVKTLTKIKKKNALATVKTTSAAKTVKRITQPSVISGIVDLVKQSAITEIASPVKQVIIDSSKPAINKFSVFKKIEGLPKLGFKKPIANTANSPAELKNYNPVKDVIDSSVKESETKKVKIELAGKIKSQRSVRLYKKIALSFGALIIVMLVFVAYLAFVKATIVLIPNQERMSNNMIVDIRDRDKSGDTSANSIIGAVSLVLMEEKGTYLASGTEIIGEEAVGKVRIINNYTKNQPLVAGTRLLTPDGVKLYRLKKTVNVPAGGESEVDIYADEPSPDSNLGPTKFTIPGLWAGLQDKIYAENSDRIVYQQKLRRKITQTDLEAARQDLRQKLMDNSKSRINETYKNYSQIIIKFDEDSIKSQFSGEVGDEKDEFSGQMQANIIAVAFNSREVAKLAKEKFISSLPENKELISFDETNIIYSLNNYNYTDGIATINVTFEGKTSLKENSQIIDVNKILGLNKKELEAYLSDLPDIAGYEVIYSPYFIKRVPNLVDRIKIEIKK